MNLIQTLTLLIFLCYCPFAITAQRTVSLSGMVVDQENKPLTDVFIQATKADLITSTDLLGTFTLDLARGNTYEIIFTEINSELKTETFQIYSDTSVVITLQQKVTTLPTVTVGTDADQFGIRQLRSLEAGGLYVGKKTEVINIDRLVGNKAANNARQAFSKVPSLNIWESDNAGLQLDIGGRGLSPNRSANFNTRQNGYDMSADALGYPESYYNPPLNAVQQIEVVRGAGALQYGSQFGGMINFKLKKGNPEKKVNFESHHTYGANNFIDTYNSVHGQVKKLNYYTYFQYKQGDGWRPNSAFDQVGAYLRAEYTFSDRLKIGIDFTHMNYLSQQAGGQTDEVFAIAPRSSNRERNWFKVNWDLGAVLLEYQATDKVKIYNRLFGLAARRTSLGLLDTPDLEDPLSNRDLLDGIFRNIGNETRVAINYKSPTPIDNTLLIGTRVYRGKTNFSQQFGSAGSDADFTRVDTSFFNRRKSDFDFPNTNLAVFAENVFNITSKLSLVPGFRLEYIKTQADGIFTNTIRINAFNDFIEEELTDNSSSNRTVFLYGLGTSYKFNPKYELYANATSNYRAINFTDVQIQTNIQVVDPDIRDESGYSFDLGVRKRNYTAFFIEGGLFYTIYGNRIGEVIDDGLRVRTNIGSARIFGAELFLEVDLIYILAKESKHKLTWFINGSVNRGTYTDINDRALVGVRSGNRLEDLPDYNIKTGITYGVGNFSSSLQSTWVGSQFSDAANTENAFIGVFGVVPNYHVMDLSMKYDFSDKIRLSFSMNNVLDASYFTRRAAAYPGPGIIPALGRIWNTTLSFNL
ncbi:MAG: TonB-dependent receptor [Bacteroidota bacterium]